VPLGIWDCQILGTRSWRHKELVPSAGSARPRHDRHHPAGRAGALGQLGMRCNADATCLHTIAGSRKPENYIEICAVRWFPSSRRRSIASQCAPPDVSELAKLLSESNEGSGLLIQSRHIRSRPPRASIHFAPLCGRVCHPADRGMLRNCYFDLDSIESGDAKDASCTNG
jgi:hypothetical protein